MDTEIRSRASWPTPPTLAGILRGLRRGDRTGGSRLCVVQRGHPNY